MVYTTIPCDMRGLARSDDREGRQCGVAGYNGPSSASSQLHILAIAVVTSIVGA